MRITCVCCGRQIVPGRGVPDSFVTYSLRPKRMFANQYICNHCDDLDEDSLFPEERELELRFKAQQCLLRDGELNGEKAK